VPAAPSGLVVTVAGTTVTVRWTDNSSNETGFTVRRQKRVGNTWTSETVVATTGANVTQITDAPGLGRWRYSVQAFNGTGTSVWTGWVQVNVN